MRSIRAFPLGLMLLSAIMLASCKTSPPIIVQENAGLPEIQTEEPQSLNALEEMQQLLELLAASRSGQCTMPNSLRSAMTLSEPSDIF